MDKLKNKAAKLIERLRYLLSGISLWQLVITLAACAAILGLVILSEHILFYEADSSIQSYTVSVEAGADADIWSVPFSFSYEGERIILTVRQDVDPDTITIYAGSGFGTAVLQQENMTEMSEYFTGNLIAAFPKQAVDIDGDGTEENVFYTAKTDIRSIQTNSSVSPLIKDNVCVFEPAIQNARTLVLYYNGARLANRDVIVTLANGLSYLYQTDDTGCIPGISLADIRRGIQIRYEPNGMNTYICVYRPEGTNLLGAAWIPALMVTVLVVVGISLYLIFLPNSKEHRRKTGIPSEASINDADASTRRRLEPVPLFTVIRWIVMIVSMFLLFYGGILLGSWFENITIPVFACGRYNEQQLTGSACYYLSHLDLLESMPVVDIVLFLISFLVPLILFGRILCSFVCPMGLMQDVLHVLRKSTGTEGFLPEERWHASLTTIKWVMTMIFLFACFAGLDFCKFCPVITMSPAFSGFKVSVYVSGLIMVIVMVASFFKNRFFCNICPLGLIMGLFHRVSFIQLKKDCTACTECGACYQACPMGIKSIYTERERETITTHNCLLCGECVRHCPEDRALRITFLGKPIYSASREAYMRRLRPKQKKRGGRNSE